MLLHRQFQGPIKGPGPTNFLLFDAEICRNQRSHTPTCYIYLIPCVTLCVFEDPDTLSAKLPCPATSNFTSFTSRKAPPSPILSRFASVPHAARRSSAQQPLRLQRQEPLRGLLEGTQQGPKRHHVRPRRGHALTSRGLMSRVAHVHQCNISCSAMVCFEGMIRAMFRMLTMRPILKCLARYFWKPHPNWVVARHFLLKGVFAPVREK